jgi:hypothetical protein
MGSGPAPLYYGRQVNSDRPLAEIPVLTEPFSLSGDLTQSMVRNRGAQTCQVCETCQVSHKTLPYSLT